jgi:AcrR family transcriptional regulator
LALAAGTSTMAVYTRFGDKQQLLAAMRREGFRRLGARLQAAASTPGAELLNLGHAYRQAALASPQLYGLMFGALPPGFQLSDDDDRAAANTFAALQQAVTTAVEAQDLLGDPDQIALHLWVVAHGMVSLELSGQLPGPAERAAQAYDQALILAAQPFLPGP